MASSYDLFFTGDHDVAKTRFGAAFAQAGFTVQARPDGNWVVSRGSNTRTILLGGLAGKAFFLSFEVSFLVDADGSLVARLNRNLAGGALRGGAIGAAKANNAFTDTYNSLLQSLTPDGTVARSIANA
jgi:hypothetical protein